MVMTYSDSGLNHIFQTVDCMTGAELPRMRVQRKSHENCLCSYELLKRMRDSVFVGLKMSCESRYWR